MFSSRHRPVPSNVRENISAVVFTLYLVYNYIFLPTFPVDFIAFDRKKRKYWTEPGISFRLYDSYPKKKVWHNEAGYSDCFFLNLCVLFIYLFLHCPQAFCVSICYMQAKCSLIYGHGKKKYCKYPLQEKERGLENSSGIVIDIAQHIF